MRKLLVVAVVVLGANSFGIDISHFIPNVSDIVKSLPRPNQVMSQQVKAKMVEVQNVCGPRPELSAATPSASSLTPTSYRD